MAAHVGRVNSVGLPGDGRVTAAGAFALRLRGFAMRHFPRMLPMTKYQANAPTMNPTAAAMR